MALLIHVRNVHDKGNLSGESDAPLQYFLLTLLFLADKTQD